MKFASVLHTLATGLASATSVDQICAMTLDAVRHALAVDRASVLLFDEDGVMRFRAWIGLSDDYRQKLGGHSPWRPDTVNPTPVLVPDVDAEPGMEPYLDAFRRERIRALAFIPLSAGRRTIGKFMLYWGSPHALDDTSLDAARALGALMTLAMERHARDLESRQREQQILFALDAANMGTWQWEVKSGQVHWSQNMERLHGLAPGTFDGAFDSYLAEVHHEDRDRVLASATRALRDAVPHDVEYRIVSPEGLVRWVHGKGRVEYDEAGAAVRMSGVCMDIGARKTVEIENAILFARAESALDREAGARERLTRLAEGARALLGSLNAASIGDDVLVLARQSITADGYAVWRVTDNVWRVVASAGVSADFAAQEVAADRHAPTTEEAVVIDVEAAIGLEHRQSAYAREGVRALISVPLAVRGRVSGGIAFYYRDQRQPEAIDIRIAQALGHLAAAAISSAELHAEQQALQQTAVRAAARARLLAEISGHLNSLDDRKNLESLATLTVPGLADWCIVDLVDDEGVLRQLSVVHVDPEQVAFARAYSARYGLRPDHPSGAYRVLRSGRSILHERVTDEALVAAARDPEQLALIRSLGPHSVMIVPLTAGAAVFGVMSFALGPGGRVYDRDDLAFAEDLARRAALGIENARLYRQAQESNRSKDDFLAALSHELRTPLNAIMGWASILREAPEQFQRGLDVIHRNAKVQAGLVDDLLDASRIASGKMPLDLVNTPLVPIIQAAIETVGPSASDAGVAIEFAQHGVMPHVWGDPARLQQVFWNILSNAVKFTERGGQVRVSLEDSGDQVRVTVADTGIGIRPEALPSIFDRFKQADASTTRRYQGLGLGLTLARQLTEMHGGRINAASAGEGTGATFVVVLPIIPAVVRPPENAPREAAGETLDTLHILVVDDDPDSLEVLTSLLQMHGARVTAASGSTEALRLLQHDRPDLLISDIAMPDRDGYWLLEQVRRLPAERGGDVKAVALSAFASVAARERALAAGFGAHISKPLTAGSLLDGVGQVLDRA
jgi:signal transduction histidine kinase/PAS domain-containing protein/ActR/RegA family two-component response regulator